MAELVDATDLKSVGCKSLRVRFPLPVLNFNPEDQLLKLMRSSEKESRFVGSYRSGFGTVRFLFNSVFRVPDSSEAPDRAAAGEYGKSRGFEEVVGNKKIVASVTDLSGNYVFAAAERS